MKAGKVERGLVSSLQLEKIESETMEGRDLHRAKAIKDLLSICKNP